MPSRRSLCYLHCTPNVSLILPCRSVTYSICLSATYLYVCHSQSLCYSVYGSLTLPVSLCDLFPVYLLLAPCIPVTYCLCLTDSPVSRFMLSFHLSLVYLSVVHCVSLLLIARVPLSQYLIVCVTRSPMPSIFLLLTPRSCSVLL